MKSFKEYRAAKKKYVQPYDTMETVFGKHSQVKLPPQEPYVQPYDTMETVFGKHSQVKPQNESVINEARTRTPEDFDINQEDHDPIHKKVTPNGLSIEQRNSLTNYTDSSSDVNTFLQRQQNHPEELGMSAASITRSRDHIKVLDSTFENHEIQSDVNVFTGVKGSPARHFRVKRDGSIPDKAIAHLPQFTSTSTSYSTANGFALGGMHPNDGNHDIYDVSRHVIKLHIPKGSKAMSVKNQSFLKDENEILVHRGADIEIDKTPTRVIDANGRLTHVWNATLLGHNPKPVDYD